MVARLVVAAPASGHGKTSVATGLLAAFADRGLIVSPHKVGPDYIDPGYHALAAGRPGRNLDPWLAGEERMRPLFEHAVATPRPAGLAIIEGVMGLHDGAAGRGEFASTAHIARLLEAPVLLVADTTAIGRSVAAMVTGYARFDPRVRVGGVVLNRVGSDRHEMILREALAEIGMPVLGALRRHDALATPSRHLGLVPAAERSASAQHTVRALGAAVASSVDLNAVLALARTAPDQAGPAGNPAWNPADEVGQIEGRPPVVAIAGGAAFTFSYAETAELLQAAGAEVVTVDPLHDEQLPADCAGLVIGGGFPELYAAQLTANVSLQRAVSRLADAGGPIAAECAGLLYLARSLDGQPMCGVLAADAVMTDRLTLGYRDAAAATGSYLAEPGLRVRGHEFHRTICSPDPGAEAAWRWTGPDGSAQRDGFAGPGRVHASYLHLHWAGQPSLAERFVRAAQQFSNRTQPMEVESR